MLRRLLIIAAALAAVAIGSPAGAFAAPANDDFAAATVVDPASLPFSDTVDNRSATTEPGEPMYCAWTGRTVWYAFTPTVSGLLKADTGGSGFYDAVLRAFRQDGSGLGGLSYLNCAFWSGSSLSFDVQAGTTYYFQASDYYTGGGSLRLNIQEILPPTNDDFADATQIGSLPFAETVDTSVATAEAAEPSLCSWSPSRKTAWYSWTPADSGSVTARTDASFGPVGVGVYTGSSLNGLSRLACGFGYGGQVVTVHVDAGTTYYYQVGSYDQMGGAIRFTLDVAPAPVAGLGYTPFDPSTVDTMQFYDVSHDPGGSSWTEAWDFGDGSAADGCCPQHRYAADADYTVTLTITTSDGRSASSSQEVHVRTHDVTIAKLSVPQTGGVGQTRQISAGISDGRYPETVQVQLLKSVPGSSAFEQVGVLTQSVPVRGGGRTTPFDFSYTFNSDDAAAGKVTFELVATIVGARDAYPGDNTAIALPTKVNG